MDKEIIFENTDLKPILNFIDKKFVSGKKKSTAVENIKELVKYLSKKDIILNYEDASKLLSSSDKLLETVTAIVENKVVLPEDNDSIDNIFLAFDLSKKPEDYYCSNFTSDYYVRNSANKDLDLMKVYLSSLPPLLTPEEELKYAQLAQAGNEEAKNRLIECNLRLVISIAKRYMNKGVPLADLIQEGNIGLITGIEHFDYSKGYKLSTYATWWIRQAVRRSVSTYSKTIRIPTHRFDLLNKASAVEKRLNSTLQRNPTEEELANELGISVEKLRDLRECDSETVSLSAPINDQDSDADELVDFIEDKRVNVEDNVLDEEYLNQFKKALLECKALDKRQKEILFLRFGIDVERPLSLEEVARKYNLTRERIRQIESKAIRRLARDKNIKKFRVSDSLDDMVFPITYYVPRNIYQSSSKNSYSRTKKYYK